MRMLQLQRLRAPSPATVRRMATAAIRSRAMFGCGSNKGTTTQAATAPAAPRRPLPHEIPLSPAEIRFAIVKGICREPRDDELAD